MQKTFNLWETPLIYNFNCSNTTLLIYICQMNHNYYIKIKTIKVLVKLVLFLDIELKKYNIHFTLVSFNFISKNNIWY